ncbi:hypothetical protein NUM3379_38220 [Kineococcus sp. NUM-3379]
MGAEVSVPIGRYRYDRSAGQWWWSEGMYELFGFAPGEVVPTAALVTHHQHPEDRTRFQSLFDGHLRDGRPFACLNRLVDAGGQERWVTWLGEDPDQLDGERDQPDGERDGAGDVVRGWVVDVTSQQQRAVADQANWHVTRALASREIIDQAKGVLMVVYRTSGDDAFSLLRWASQRGNVKLTTLAEQLLDAVRDGLDLGPTARARVDDVISGMLTGRQDQDQNGGRNGSRADTDGDGSPQDRRERLRTLLSTEGRIPVLRVSGEVDLSTAPEFSAALNHLVAAGRAPAPVVVDLREATHLGSVGIAMLAVANRRCEAAATPLRIVAPSAPGPGLTTAHGLTLFPSLPRALSG